MEKTPAVSVLCTAYNHEKYIAKALESMVTQQTDFPFEVIVHDDASTDSTADIIREYEGKYPHIIKPVYQTENQYQKGLSISLYHMLPRARGKYIAICEGDDYWTDVTKLQKQYDYMETHPDCPLAAHESIVIFENGEYMSRFSSHDFSAPGASLLSVEDVIRHANDFHTSSLFYRREYIEKNRPFLETVPMFDYVTKIMCASDMPGKVCVIPETMSAYRFSSAGSWSQRVRDNNERYCKHIERSIDTLRRINEYRGFKYNDAFEEEITDRQLKIEIAKGNKKAWKDPKYKSRIARMSKKAKMVTYLELHMPKTFLWLRRMYQQIKKYTEG